ncbi:MAG TPA: membrane protein insertase YidC [Gemmatales bacterium]|nr:membrane protein insertase YidC [Gemmatales bacterium]
MGIDSLSQRQRFWLFVTLTTVTLLGYSLLSRLWMKEPKAEQAKATEVAKGTEPAKAGEKKDTAPAGKNEVAQKDQIREPFKEAEPIVDRNDALNKLLASRGEEKQHVLGDETSKLKVVFSDRGGIRSMTLNDHEASDRQTGRRLEPNASGQRPRLTLVTDDEDKFDPKKPRSQQPLSKQFELLSYRLALFNDKEQIPAELAALPWKQLDGATSEKLSYVAEVPSKNLKITKNFTLEKDTYHISMELQFAPIDSSKPTQFTYELSGPQGLPIEGLRWKPSGSSFRHYVFVTQDAEKTTNLSRTLEGIEKLNKDGPPRSYTLNETKGKQNFLFGGVMIQFFASLAIVDHGKDETPPFLIDKVLAEFVGNDYDAPEFYKDRQGRMTTKLVSTPVTLEKGQTVSHKYLLYAGPSKAMLLRFEQGVQPGLYERYADQLHLDQMTDATDFPNGPFQRLGITGLLVKSTNMMHFLLEWLHSVVMNYGIAIIFMTVLVRLCLFPLSRKQAQNQAKMQEQMKVMRPEMEKIKKQFANDRQAYAAAQMELFKKHKMSPLAGCNGCWILFLQMPVFLGLYFALRESIHLRLAGFLWIDNLAMPDMLLHWGDHFVTNLPISFLYLGPYLHILPIISVSVMYMYQKLMAPPAMDEQQEQQIKMMNYMTLVMGLAFYWVASGLCLYFIVSSLWGMVERKFTKKAKEQAVAQWQEKRDKGNDKSKSDEEKPARGVRGKLGDMWRDLQNRADKRS